uniref:Uncharacterized protein n=1 Tax=Macrostomum lignano TaxID=282301 RepID=A0A1I8F6L6_9PLAT
MVTVRSPAGACRRADSLLNDVASLLAYSGMAASSSDSCRNELGMSKVCAQWVPRLLSQEQKDEQKNYALRELVLRQQSVRLSWNCEIAYGLEPVLEPMVRADGAICLCDSLAVNQELETSAARQPTGWSIQGCKSLAKSPEQNNRIDARWPGVFAQRSGRHTSNSLWPKPMARRQGLTVDQQTIQLGKPASERPSLQPAARAKCSEGEKQD